MHQGHYDNLKNELRDEYPLISENFLQLDEAIYDMAAGVVVVVMRGVLCHATTRLLFTD